jgi:hypothetical protein
MDDNTLVDSNENESSQIQRDLIIISCRSSDTWNLIRRQ